MAPQHLYKNFDILSIIKSVDTPSWATLIVPGVSQDVKYQNTFTNEPYDNLLYKGSSQWEDRVINSKYTDSFKEYCDKGYSEDKWVHFLIWRKSKYRVTFALSVAWWQSEEVIQGVVIPLNIFKEIYDRLVPLFFIIMITVFIYAN